MTMANKTKIDAILQKTSTVQIGEHTLDLVMPSPKQLGELRSLQLTAAKFSEDQLRGEEGIECLSAYTTRCVAYVLGTDEESAAAVLFATGGEGGSLFKAIQQFLGMTSIEDDGSTDDPS